MAVVMNAWSYAAPHSFRQRPSVGTVQFGRRVDSSFNGYGEIQARIKEWTLGRALTPGAEFRHSKRAIQ